MTAITRKIFRVNLPATELSPDTILLVSALEREDVLRAFSHCPGVEVVQTDLDFRNTPHQIVRPSRNAAYALLSGLEGIVTDKLEPLNRLNEDELDLLQEVREALAL